MCTTVIIPCSEVPVSSVSVLLCLPTTMQITSTLELYPEYTVTQLLFKDVKNAAELRKKAMDGHLQGALLNPSMVRKLGWDNYG